MEKIALLGMMACGKTTLGKKLAERLSVPMIDADEEIERRAGMSIPEIFRSRGEDGFRRLEREVLDDLLNRPGTTVVALGGGAYMQEEVKALLRNRAVSVYLRVLPDELIRRLEKTDVAGRPLLAACDDWRGRAREIAASRDAGYKDADIIFPASDNNVAALTERLANVLSSRLCRCSLEAAHA